ncbi:hypothetical protein I553_3388 [Mycobacterium xenopi 4042]|uniref:Uncharacterized protein n=1 Tax=Mycobacterium xenopi 4042 TaxID=1299334 RepID=X8BBH0_MYCXE|nr:hypothetical protein I553_3388 [Mycobacterium xenopi 4042]
MADIDANTKKPPNWARRWHAPIRDFHPSLPAATPKPADRERTQRLPQRRAQGIHTYNQSVDAMRAAPAPYRSNRATDQSGADTVNRSAEGGTYTI